MAETRLEHPNRDRAGAKATRAAVVLLLVISAVLVAVVTLGGFTELQGMVPLAAGYFVIYLVIAFFVLRWNRGVLPVAAAGAVLLAVFAAVAAPPWFARDKPGFDSPALEPSILGLLTVILIPVSVLLIAFALRGFRQAWNVEVEVHDDDHEYGGYEGRPQTAWN